MWALPSFGRRKLEHETTGFIMCFEQEKRKENFILWTSEK
jgi:hypothetical protein